MIPLPTTKRFKFASDAVLMATLIQIVHQKIVGSNPIHGIWAKVFHTELGLKMQASVLR